MFLVRCIANVQTHIEYSSESNSNRFCAAYLFRNELRPFLTGFNNTITCFFPIKAFDIVGNSIQQVGWISRDSVGNYWVSNVIFIESKPLNRARFIFLWIVRQGISYKTALKSNCWHTLPAPRSDEFASIQKVNISEESQWCSSAFNSSVRSGGRVSYSDMTERETTESEDEYLTIQHKQME
jgi:hypothetical protein